jgi:nicotinamidase/pyrazinamidase
MIALILNHLQNDFMPLGAEPLPDAESFVDKANASMEKYDMVIAIQKWYPATHPMFAANHPWRKPGQEIEIEGEKVELKIIHCVAESFGAAFPSSLDQSKINYIIRDEGEGSDIIMGKIKALVQEHKVETIEVLGPRPTE